MTTATKLKIRGYVALGEVLTAVSFERLRRGHEMHDADDASRLEQDLVRRPN